MARELYIESGKEDQFKVVSTKYKKGKFVKRDVYNVDLRNHFCPCDGFHFKRNCTHIKTIIALLKAKGIGIYWNKNTDSYYTNWDFQDIMKETVMIK